MPLYDFYCEHCGEFEQMAKLDGENTVVACPICGNQKTQRMYSPPTFNRVFVGSRHKLMRHSEKNIEPKVVKKQVGTPLEGTSPMPHVHGHGCSHASGANLGYPPWMIKH